MGRSQSPNVRYGKPTKEDFDEIRDWATRTLGVGERTVTVDILGAALNTVGSAHRDELLQAIRDEIARKGKA